MNPAVFLEISSSLVLQITLMIGIVMWASRRQWDGMGSDATWTALHASILLLTAAAFLFPHLRPITLADFDLDPGSSTWSLYCRSVGYVCFWLWVTGALAMSAALVGGIWRAAYLVRHTAASDELTCLLRQIVGEDRATARPIEVRVSSISVSPFCWQIHRPLIVVPDLLLDFSPAEKLAVLRHELAHLRAQHPLGLFLQRLIETIYWFHPLVWRASRLAAGAREFRCDRSVVQSKQDLADYLRSLLRLIESQIPPPNRLPAGLGFLGDSNLLCKRAEALTAWLERQANPGPKRATALAAFVAVALFTLIWLPVNPEASRRSWWSPWPAWSASALDATGIQVRDYEIDGHRLQPQENRG